MTDVAEPSEFLEASATAGLSTTPRHGDGQTWAKLADTGPEARGMGYMAYDKSRDRIVMFGGRKGYPDGDLNDTCEWHGTDRQRGSH